MKINLTANLYCSITLIILFALQANAQNSETESQQNLQTITNHKIKNAKIANIIGLNKRSGQAKKIRANVGDIVKFETIAMQVITCKKIIYKNHNDAVALIQVSNNEKKILFQGWMYSKYPSINAMQHPTYNLWVKNCI